MAKETPQPQPEKKKLPPNLEHSKKPWIGGNIVEEDQFPNTKPAWERNK